MGSFWYLKVYYIVTVFGVLFLNFSKHVKWIIGVCLALTIYFNIDNDVMKNFAPYYPSGQVGYVAYYLQFSYCNSIERKKIKDVFVPVLYGLVALSLVLFSGISEMKCSINSISKNSAENSLHCLEFTFFSNNFCFV
jgi:TctA family transporter